MNRPIAAALAILLLALPALAVPPADGRGVPLPEFSVRLVLVSGIFAEYGYEGPCGPVVATQVRTVYRQGFPDEENQQTLYFWGQAACDSLELDRGASLLITDAVYFGSSRSASAPGIGGDRVDVFAFEEMVARKG